MKDPSGAATARVSHCPWPGLTGHLSKPLGGSTCGRDQRCRGAGGPHVEPQGKRRRTLALRAGWCVHRRLRETRAVMRGWGHVAGQAGRSHMCCPGPHRGSSGHSAETRPAERVGPGAGKDRAFTGASDLQGGTVTLPAPSPGWAGGQEHGPEASRPRCTVFRENGHGPRKLPDLTNVYELPHAREAGLVPPACGREAGSSRRRPALAPGAADPGPAPGPPDALRVRGMEKQGCC